MPTASRFVELLDRDPDQYQCSEDDLFLQKLVIEHLNVQQRELGTREGNHNIPNEIDSQQIQKTVNTGPVEWRIIINILRCSAWHGSQDIFHSTLSKVPATARILTTFSLFGCAPFTILMTLIYDQIQNTTSSSLT
ncbi:hypothetical protein FQN57_004181 [Myotisia sp. PD_48]|nr:hypothetical protein FQN57_004181 [Myotisia sp. PD_48]